MNKDYLEYQYSKSKKLTERAFRLRIAMLMVSILVCAGIMASSAFALFTCDINRSTTLTAASFEVLGWNPIQQTSDDINITHIVDIYTTPGVLGYCRIPVYGADNTIHYYFTEAFSGGHMQVSIATAGGAHVGKPEGYWGNPRNYLGPEAEIIGNGALVTHSYAVPQQEESSGGEGSGGMLTMARPSSGTPVSEDTPTTEDTTESTPETEKETVTEEKTVETTEKAENSDTTVIPSVSEEKASVENSNSTVVEAPVTSTPPSDNSSDSGTSDSSGNSSDSGNSSGSVSSGTEASTGGSTAPVSDGGGE